MTEPRILGRMSEWLKQATFIHSSTVVILVQNLPIEEERWNDQNLDRIRAKIVFLLADLLLRIRFEFLLVPTKLLA